jgi:hypothetical protein
MYVISLVFVSAMFNLGLLASCLTRRSSISLLSALFFWVLLVQIVPNAGAYLAAHLDPIGSQEVVNSQLEIVSNERNKEIDELWDRVEQGGEEVASEDQFGQWCVIVCDAKGMRHRQQRFALGNPIRLRYAERSWQIKHGYATDLLRQKKLADRLARLSPIAAYQNAMSALAGTDVAGARHFIEEAREHRTAVIAYLRSETDNFSSPLYFTRCTEVDRGFYQQYLDKQVSEEDFQRWKTRTIGQVPPLDLRDFPRFVYRNDVIPTLANALADTLALAFAGLLFFALSFWVFMRYDIR